MVMQDFAIGENLDISQYINRSTENKRNKEIPLDFYRKSESRGSGITAPNTTNI